MPRTKSALKQMRRSERRRLQNRAVKRALRTAIKKVKEVMDEKDLQRAQEALLKTIPLIDKAVTKGVIHKNRAARYKSRLSHQLNLISPGVRG